MLDSPNKTAYSPDPVNKKKNKNFLQKNLVSIMSHKR